MEILSYILSSVATVLGLLEPFNKKMKHILIFNFLGNLLVGISYLLVSSYSGAVICGVALLQLMINYTYTSNNKAIPIFIIIIHGVSFVGINMLIFRMWYDILALIASLLFVLSVAQEKTKHYRLLYGLNSMSWIAYDLLAGAYGNLSTHIILFIATSIAIFMRDKSTMKE